MLAVLVVVIMGTQLPKDLVVARLSPDVVLIAIVWVVGLMLTQRAGTKLPWSNSGEAPDSQPKPRGHSQKTRSAEATRRGVSTTRVVLVFGAAALATLVAGALAEESGSAAADQVGLSGALFGATVLAAATSLPELSTGLTAVRQGDYKLAFGDIFGGNAFLPVLFLLAVLVSGKAVLPNAHAADIYLTGLGRPPDDRLHGRPRLPPGQGARPPRDRQHRRARALRRRRRRTRRAPPVASKPWHQGTSVRARASGHERGASGHERRRVRLRQRDHGELDELVLLDPVTERSEPVGDLRLRVVAGEVDGGDEEDPPRPDELEVQEGDPLDLVTAAEVVERLRATAPAAPPGRRGSRGCGR